MGRVWSIISLGDDRQYGGNRGYDDEPRRLYLYDSNVANHRQLAKGDMVVVRDSEVAVGVARIVEIRQTKGLKLIQRCPQCGITSIKERRNALPRWRCSAGHVFSDPVQNDESVELYTADFGNTFIVLPPGISKTKLKSIALRPSDQVSIEELDTSRLEEVLAPLSIRAVDELSSTVMGEVIGSEESSDDAKEERYVGSTADMRKKVLREVRARRGQQKFRRALMRRYNSRCMVTGCEIIDLLEAAHIWPYRGDSDNHLGNGLLLRADIHTLFDLNLFAIDPENLSIHLDKRINRSGYQGLDGKPLMVGRQKPSPDALERRWKIWLGKSQT